MLTTQGLASEVRAEIARKGLRNLQISQATGISTSTLSRKLRGKGDFTVAELVKIADFLGIEAAQLLIDAMTEGGAA